MQQSSNMKSDETEPSASVSVSSSETDLQLLVEDWPVEFGFQDAFTQDALLDEALVIMKACCGWMTEYHTEHGYDIPDPDNPLNSSHPLAQALYFLRQFTEPSSSSENG